jgi:hypothetical protein
MIRMAVIRPCDQNKVRRTKHGSEYFLKFQKAVGQTSICKTEAYNLQVLKPDTPAGFEGLRWSRSFQACRRPMPGFWMAAAAIRDCDETYPAAEICKAYQQAGTPKKLIIRMRCDYYYSPARNRQTVTGKFGDFQHRGPGAPNGFRSSSTLYWDRHG